MSLTLSSNKVGVLILHCMNYFSKALTWIIDLFAVNVKTKRGRLAVAGICFFAFVTARIILPKHLTQADRHPLSSISCEEIESLRLGLPNGHGGFTYKAFDVDPCWLISTLGAGVRDHVRAFDRRTWWRIKLVLDLNTGVAQEYIFQKYDKDDFIGVKKLEGIERNFLVNSPQLVELLEEEWVKAAD